MKRYIFLFILLISTVTESFAIDPDCPYCQGTGMHQEGGTSISHVNIVCRNCGEIYDGFYTHQCSCTHCADYHPVSVDPDASWEDDMGYIEAQKYARQKYSTEIYEDDETPSYPSGKVASEKRLNLKMPEPSSNKNDGIPSWIWYVGLCIVVVIGKIIFDT